MPTSAPSKLSEEPIPHYRNQRGTWPVWKDISEDLSPETFQAAACCAPQSAGISHSFTWVKPKGVLFISSYADDGETIQMRCGSLREAEDIRFRADFQAVPGRERLWLKNGQEVSL